MNHYVAYHSVALMGYAYDPGTWFKHLSRKPEKQLRQAVGASAWTIDGERVAGLMRYRLVGVFTPSKLSKEADSWVIEGRGTPFDPPVELTSLPWFAALRTEQNKFSYGFNRIRGRAIIAALADLASARQGPLSTERPAVSIGPADVDGPVGRPSKLMDSCVYTIVSRDRLDPVALERTALVNKESRSWKKGSALLEEARSSGKVLPILLADAKDCSRLLYWGHLTKIVVGATETEYTVDRLRRIPGERSPQELVLSSTGEFIAPGFIRPYALCETPEFIQALEEETTPLGLSALEGTNGGMLLEGEAGQVTLDVFERNPEARRQCIAHYGCRCVVCGFDFESRYGEIGKGFIHVHHVIPISESGSEHVVDPVRDLRPVCPNCHAMFHHQKPVLGVDALTAALRI